MKLLARLASERAVRDAAAEDLRFIRSLSAVMGLMFGGPEGKRFFHELDSQLRDTLAGPKEPDLAGAFQRAQLFVNSKARPRTTDH